MNAQQPKAQAQPRPSRRRFLGALLLSGAGVGLAAAAPEAARAGQARQTVPLSGPVNRLRLSGGYDLVLVQGEAPSLVIEGSNAALNHFDSHLDSGLLVLRHKGMSWFHNDDDMKVTLTLPHLAEIHVDGAANLSCARWAASETLTLEVSGAADCHIDHLEVPRFAVHLSGTGDIELSGKVTNQEVHISGTGDYKAAQLRSDNVDLHVSGAADVEVWALQRLDVQIAGTADVKYFGHPQVNRSIAGAASVESGGEAPPGAAA